MEWKQPANTLLPGILRKYMNRVSSALVGVCDLKVSHSAINKLTSVKFSSEKLRIGCEKVLYF